MKTAKEIVEGLRDQGMIAIACGKEIDGVCEWGDDADRCGEDADVVVVLAQQAIDGNGKLVTAAVPFVFCSDHAHALEDEYERVKLSPL